MVKKKFVEQVAELNSLRLRMFEFARNTSNLIEPADFDGYRDEIREMFNRLYELSVELVTRGSADGLSAISDLHGSLRQYAMMKIDSPEARDVFVLALCERFQLNEDMYSRIIDGGMSQEVRVNLFLSLVDYEPLNENMIVYLNGIDDKNYMTAFTYYFGMVCAEIDRSNLIAIALTFKKRLSVKANLAPYIESFSANIDRLAPGYQRIIDEASLDWPQGGVGLLKDPIYGVLGLPAEFLCGLHSFCNTSLTESMCKIGLRNPIGRYAYVTYEQHGLVESPEWHIESQRRSRNAKLSQHHSYAITNDEVSLVLPEHTQFGSRSDLESYLNDVIGAPMLGESSFKKLKSIIDYVLQWESVRFKSFAESYIMSSSIDPKFLASHPRMLGDKFSKDLGM